LLSDPVTRAFADLQSCGYDNSLVLEIVTLLEFNDAADHVILKSETLAPATLE
jgi:hypothetical protein